MSVAQKLEQLVRIVPGVAGYQDRESSRDTDHALRLRLADELERLKRSLEEDTRQLAERRALDLLPSLGRVCAKLDKLAHLIRFAARGYRGVFDGSPLDEGRLDQLYAFDLGLFEDLASMEGGTQAVRDALDDAPALQRATRQLDGVLDTFEQSFAKRALLLEGQREAQG